MATTIVVTNRKGGVGKTTVATHLATGLALRGLTVGLVDTDPQGHSAVVLGLPKENGLYEIMCNEDAKFADIVRVPDPVRYTPPNMELNNERLFLIPGDKATAIIPMQQQNPFKFREVLEDFADLLELDVIIVDTGPTASMFDGSVNFAADAFIYVTECASLSFDGLSESLAEVQQFTSQNRRYRTGETTIMGIIPNKLRANTRNHRDNIAELAEHFERSMVWSPVMLGTVWESAADNQQMVYSYAPEGQEAADAWRIVDRVLEALGVAIHE